MADEKGDDDNVDYDDDNIDDDDDDLWCQTNKDNQHWWQDQTVGRSCTQAGDANEKGANNENWDQI